MPELLEDLRCKIDELDRTLIALLSERLEVVNRVAEIKKQQGLPLYCPEREASMLAARQKEAMKQGISPQFINDILRRIIRESYTRENNLGFTCTNPQANKIIIVGGYGKMGSIFSELFRLSHYEVINLGEMDWPFSSQQFKDASLVLLAVPIDKTLSIISKLPPLPSTCVLADITSIKSKPIAEMLKIHPGPVVGLHPMFGPHIKNLAKQVIIHCNGRNPGDYEWLLEQLRIWGAQLQPSTPEQHDKIMRYIQVLKHFTSFTYGVYLRSEEADIGELLDFSSPTYRFELAMVGRLLTQSPELYAEIILSSPENIAMMRRYHEMFGFLLQEIEQKGSSSFINYFEETKAFFDKYTSQLLKESNQLLAHVNDVKEGNSQDCSRA